MFQYSNTHCNYSNSQANILCCHPKCHLTPSIICASCPNEKGCKLEHLHNQIGISFIEFRELYVRATYFLNFANMCSALVSSFISTSNILDMNLAKLNIFFKNTITRYQLQIIQHILRKQMSFLTGYMISRVLNKYLTKKVLTDLKAYIDRQYLKLINCDAIAKSEDAQQEFQDIFQSQYTQQQILRLSAYSHQYLSRIHYSIMQNSISNHSSQQRIITLNQQRIQTRPRRLINYNESNENDINQKIFKAQSMYFQALKLMHKPPYQRAEKLLVEIFMFCRDFGFFYDKPLVSLGKIFKLKKQYIKSEQIFKYCLTQTKQQLEIYMEYGNLLVQTKQYDKCQILYNQATKHLSSKVKLKTLLQKFILFHITYTHNHQQAQNLLIQGIQNQVWSYNQVDEYAANFYYSIQQYNKSLYHFQNLLNKFNEKKFNIAIYTKIAYIYIYIKKYQTSLQFLDQIPLNPQNETLIYYLKIINYRNLKQFPRRIEYINKMINKQSNWTYLRERALLFNQLNKYQQSIAIYQYFYNISTSDFSLVVELIQLYQKTNNLEKFNNIIHKYKHDYIKHTDSELSIMFNMFGNINKLKKNYKSAILCYTQAVSLHQDAQYYANRAQCFIQLNFLENAIEDFLMAAQYKNVPEWLYRISLLNKQFYLKDPTKLQNKLKRLNYLDFTLNLCKYFNFEMKIQYLVDKADTLLDIADVEFDDKRRIRVAESLQLYCQALKMDPNNETLISQILTIQRNLSDWI